MAGVVTIAVGAAIALALATARPPDQAAPEVARGAGSAQTHRELVGASRTTGRAAPAPLVSYALTLDSAHLDVTDVRVRVRGVPVTFHLAMKAHAEYDAKYWRHLDGIQITCVNGHAGTVAREDSTLWRLDGCAGGGDIQYRVHIQPPPTGLRRAWLPYARDDGAFINPPDFFLYVPELSSSAVSLELRIPQSWQVATALRMQGTPTRRSAPNAQTFLDSPILIGHFKLWNFTDQGTIYHVAYWPLPGAVAFDTTRFVDRLRRVAHAAALTFGPLPASSDYWFLIQDGAEDALEHGASVTIGVPSERLARDPGASTTEITHEFVHTWNLVAIRPAGYNDLSYRAPSRTPSLWIGEGVTLYYADLLPRRAGIADTASSRLDHLAALVQSYDASPVLHRVSPERSSLAFEDSPVDNPDATGGYYLQGELLGDVLNAVLLDSTNGRRGLDDVMRAMLARAATPGGRTSRGYTPSEFEHVADSVCRCRLDNFFAREVRGPGPIDVTPVLARIGLRAVVDSVPAKDSTGGDLPDLRLNVDFRDPARPLIVIRNPSTPWAAAGLRTGDWVLAIDGRTVHSFAELRAALDRLHLDGQGHASAVVEIARGADTMHVRVDVRGYQRPRVRFVDTEPITPDQRARRAAWLAGLDPR